MQGQKKHFRMFDSDTADSLKNNINENGKTAIEFAAIEYFDGILQTVMIF